MRFSSSDDSVRLGSDSLMNEYREWYKSHGICIRCGARSAEPGKTECAECSEKNRIRYAEYYKKNRLKIKERTKNYRQKKYHENKSKSVCVICGKPLYQEKSSVYCMEHYLSIKRKHKSRRKKKYDSPDFCRYCDEPVVPGKKLCAKHYEKYVKIAEQARAHIDHKNHIWRKTMIQKKTASAATDTVKKKE